MKNEYIIGIGGFLHDGNVAVLDESGDIQYASQIERFNRKKHSSIDEPQEIIDILTKEVRKDIFEQVKHIVWVDEYLFENSEKKNNIKDWLQSLNIPIQTVDHHIAHLSSAFYNSQFEDATLLSIDGKGDAASAKIAFGKQNKIEELLAVPMEYSIGRLWNAVNSIVGFPGYQYSGKTMALASFGEPVYVDEILKYISVKNDGSYFFHKGDQEDTEENREFFFKKENIIDLLCNITELNVRPSGRIEKIEKKYADLAASIQVITNMLAINLVKRGVAETGSRNLCLAGGVSLNGNMNKAILDSGIVENIFIQPAASDMGLALGGAQYHYHNNLENPKIYKEFSPYLGHDILEESIEEKIKLAGLNFKESAEIEKETAKLLEDGNIVAWVQGREEFGPRALGNRSILVSPLIKGMKDTLNKRVKHREFFRPFAASVPVEESSSYFEFDIDSPYMLLIDKVRSEFRDILSSIVHIDGSVRLQTVDEEMNERYYKLLKEFGNISNIPVLLNTSLNDNGEPIVSTVDDALSFFKKGQVDFLVIDNYIISNPNNYGK